MLRPIPAGARRAPPAIGAGCSRAQAASQDRRHRAGSAANLKPPESARTKGNPSVSSFRVKDADRPRVCVQHETATLEVAWIPPQMAKQRRVMAAFALSMGGR